MKSRQLLLVTALSVLVGGVFTAQAYATSAGYDRTPLTPAQMAALEKSEEEFEEEVRQKTESFMEEYYGTKDGPMAEQYAKQEQLEASRKKIAAYNMTWQERKKQIEDEKILAQQKLQDKEQAAKDEEKLVAPRQVYRPADRKQDNAPPRLFNNVR